jgi:hypothetical protein
MIVFGGESGACIGNCLSSSDVWVLENANGLDIAPQWIQLAPTGGPPADRYAHVAVYDSTNNRMIVFGGLGSSGFLHDAWVLTNANGVGGTPQWIQLAPIGGPPPAGVWSSGVYDSGTNRMIVFGGESAACLGFCSASTDVWILTNANGIGGAAQWIQLAPTGGPPPDRFAHMAIYDSVSNRMTLFGGLGSSGVLYDAWVLANANGIGGSAQWIQLSPTGGPPPLGIWSRGVYDSGTNRMITYGGEISPCLGFCGATAGGGFLENANGLGTIPPNWIPNLGAAAPRPPDRYAHVAVYDSRTNRLIAFGGLGSSGYLHDAWFLNNANGVPSPRVVGNVIPGNLVASINGAGAVGPGTGFILQYTPTGTPSTIALGLDKPRGLAFDNSGNLFVATNTFNGDLGVFQGTILKITPGATVSTFATGFPDNFFLSGLATDSAGNVFVMANNENDPNFASIIYEVPPGATVSPSPFGLQSDCIQSDGSNCSIPGQGVGLAFDSSGNLYAADAVFQTIYKFTPDRHIFVGPAAFASEAPAGLAFDSSGNFFVSTFANSANPGDDAIFKFTPNGTETWPETTFATGLNENPRGLAADLAGSLFVAEMGWPTTIVPQGAVALGDILKFASDGTETVPDFASGIGVASPGITSGPEYLAFQSGANTPANPAGSPVPVDIGTVGSATDITLTFPQVTVGGMTTVTPITLSSTGTLPTGFDATNALAFDITTTASYTTPVIIAFQVPPPLDVTTLHIFHDEGGTLVDVTVLSGPFAPNPTTRTIYASVSSLSPFVIAKETLKARVQQPINLDGSSVFSVKRGVVPVTFTLTSNGVATCKLPPAKISVIRTAGTVVGSIDESTYLLSADKGSNFRISNCQYVYNLATSSLGTGTYKLNILIGGSVVGSGTFALK